MRGTEACVCYPNGTCNDGLECLSSLCVHREGTGGTATGQGGGNTDAGAGPEISGGSPTTEGGSPSGGVGHGGSASGGTNSASGGDSGGDSGGSGPEGEGGAVTGGVSSGGKAQGGSGGSSSGGFTGGAGAGGSAQGGKGGSGGSAQGGSGGAGKGGSGGAGGQGGTTGGVGGSAGQSGKGGSAGASPCGGAAGASTLFLDTFECGLNAWTQSVSGAFAIGLDGSNTLERATVATSLVTARAGDATWGNVRIEARVKALSFGNAQATSYVILYGHFVDANNYIAMAWQGDGTVAYRQRKNGGGSDTYNQATLLTTGQWYTFALELSADTAKGFVNGTLIHDTSLNPISTGRIAFGTANASARFDDVRVIQLP